MNKDDDDDDDDDASNRLKKTQPRVSEILLEVLLTATVIIFNWMGPLKKILKQLNLKSYLPSCHSLIYSFPTKWIDFDSVIGCIKQETYCVN